MAAVVLLGVAGGCDCEALLATQRTSGPVLAAPARGEAAPPAEQQPPERPRLPRGPRGALSEEPRLPGTAGALALPSAAIPPPAVPGRAAMSPPPVAPPYPGGWGRRPVREEGSTADPAGSDFPPRLRYLPPKLSSVLTRQPREIDLSERLREPADEAE